MPPVPRRHAYFVNGNPETSGDFSKSPWLESDNFSYNTSAF